MSAEDKNSDVFNYFLKVKSDFRARSHTMSYKSVIQLLLTYGLFYKSATTRGLLPTE